MSRRRLERALVALVALVLTAGPFAPSAGAELLLGNADAILAREGQTTPQDLGSDPLDGLIYADPTDQLPLIAPPEPNNQGSAQLQYELVIPEGRGGLAPDLTLAYDSAADGSWMGVGWDIGSSEIAVDTEFGVPRYSATQETESYALDGDMLSPNAIRSTYQDRRTNADGVVFTRRVDSQFDQVRRFGSKPGEYYWVVSDKAGNVRYYGAVPSINAADELVVTRDPGAILADVNGNEARWALSAEIDISYGLVRYHYMKTGYVFGSWAASSAAEPTGGVHLWLSEIDYTGSLVRFTTFEAEGDPRNVELAPAGRDAAYRIEFLRDGDYTPGPVSRRPDIEIDARAGFLQSTPDLLRAIRVAYRPQGSTVQAWETVRQYDFEYETGPFDKTRLAAAKVYGSDGNTGSLGAEEQFAYFDEFVEGQGFADATEWNTKSDSLSEPLLFTTAESSVLGTSVGNAFDVHMYYGFNKLDPMKYGSLGGSFTIDGSGSDGLVEFFDINGDLLPDKVFRAEIDKPVRYRLNLGRTGQPKFDETSEAPLASGLEGLSYDVSVGGGGAFESYVAATVQFSISGEVSVGARYFTDVNNDSLVDYVADGVVFFNHLKDGKPTFSKDSRLTAVPMNQGSISVDPPAEVTEALARQSAQNPPQDVVRRWIAPFDGRVEITGEPIWDPPTSGPHAGGDGVIVSIDTAKAHLYDETLADVGVAGTLSGVDDITVAKGQQLFFRVRGGADTDAFDTRWSPIVSYLSFDHSADAPVPDANGLDQAVYDAAAEFTLAGRPGVAAVMPLTGSVMVEGVLGKSAPTSDDLRIVVFRDDTLVASETVAAAATGDIPFNATFDVKAPVLTGQTPVPQKVRVRIEADTEVDLSVLDWQPELYYLSATDANGDPLTVRDKDTNEPLLRVDVPVDIDLYPNNSLDAPIAPFTSDADAEMTLTASLTTGKTEGGRAVLSVKSGDGMVAEKSFQVAKTSGGPVPAQTLTFDAVDGETYWFDVSVADPGLGPALSGGTASLSWTDNGADKSASPPLVRRWTGGQDSYFPIGYRGWAYAGYNGSGGFGADPIDPDVFKIDPALFDSLQDPKGFDDPNFKNPAAGRAFAFFPASLEIPAAGGGTPRTGVWRGATEDIVGAPDLARTLQAGSSIVAGSSSSEETAPRLVSVSAPSFGLAAGFLVVGGGLTAGWDFGLVGYEDLNGDSFPDVITPKTVEYTGPRGGYAEKVSDQEALTVVSQDTGFSFAGGIGGSLPEFKGKVVGQESNSNSTAGSGSAPAGSGDTQKTSSTENGVQLGASFGLGYALGNPTLADSDADIARAKEEIGEDEIKAYLEEKLADMNGDGLPDKVKVNNDGVWVRFNMGYGFQDEAVRWAVDGGFEQGESYSGAVGPTASFSSPYFEWSGGITYNESADLTLYAWDDLNGDGLLDRMRRAKSEGTDPKLGIIDTATIKVAFGNGTGIGDEVDFGTFQEMHFALQPEGKNAKNLISVAQGKATGFGFDIAIPIGPLCVPTPFCYIILNPGVHGEHSISTTPVQLTDIDGDGLPDSVRSESDGSMSVKRNTTGRTNLLRSVLNHLGGEIRLGYTRDGNTPEQPYPLWNLSSVQVDDNQAGDGPDTLVSTFEYDGNVFNSLERSFLGYRTVTVSDRMWVADPATPGDKEPWEDDLGPDELEKELLELAALRKTVTEYRNGSIFDIGLVERETSYGAGGVRTVESISDWTMVDPLTGAEVETDPSAADPAGVGLLDVAASPLLARFEQRWFDGNDDLGRRTWNTFEYDPRGSVVRQIDVGDPETEADDVVAETTYADCDFAQAIPMNLLLYHPLAGGGREILRERDGGSYLTADLGLCTNLAVTVLGERTGPGPDDFVWTVLNFDTWGNYDCVWYNAPKPAADVGGDGCYDTYDASTMPNGYRVLYEFDPERHTDIALVTDTHDISANATYDGLTGYVTSRTDANGAMTTYTYDALGRLETMHGPYEQDGNDPPTVSLSYTLARPGTVNGNAVTLPAFAIAKHFDAVNSGLATNTIETIDTARFLDGIGREIQTKQDGHMAGSAPEAGTDALIVGDAIEFDWLGRPIKEWQPTVQPLADAAGKSNLGVFWPETTADRFVGTTFDDQGLIKEMRAADGFITKRSYAYANMPDDSRALVVTTTDPQDRATIESFDIRDNVVLRQDAPDGATAMTTRYAFDPIAQLRSVTDNGGNVTTHEYDLLGRRTATDTPDSGLVEYAYDGLGNVVSRLDARGRNQIPPGPPTVFEFDGDWLLHVDYPGSTPDVSYTYGDMTPPGSPPDPARGAGRVLSIDDGARTRHLTYDPLGSIATDTATMKVHNLNPSTADKYTYTTSMTYDGLGRLRTLTYPDGEALTMGYDSGGLINEATGAKGLHTYDYLEQLEYDEFFDRKFQQLGNGVTTAYAYHDGNRRLKTQTTTGSGSQVLQALTYTYDKVGNVESAVNAITSPTGKFKALTSTQNYDYDAFYRLDYSDGNAPIQPGDVRAYTYDPTYDSQGRITAKVQTDAQTRAPRSGGGGGGGNGGGGTQPGAGNGSTLPTTYTLGGFKYDNGKPYQVSAIDGVSRQYDPNGNTSRYRALDGKTMALTWDTADRLTEVTDGLTTNRYKYDVDGKLAIVEGTNAETSFVNPWFVTEGGTKWKTVWIGEDRLVTKKVQDLDYEIQQFYFHKNLQGSTNVITIADGGQFARWEYFPSGQPWLSENSTTSKTPSWFTGAYLDPDFNLFNHGVRWYDFGTEQMLSPDPLLLDDPLAAADDSGLLPAYSYAESNPARFIDLSGRDPSLAQSKTTAASPQNPPKGLNAPAPPAAATQGGGAPTPVTTSAKQGLAGSSTPAANAGASAAKAASVDSTAAGGPNRFSTPFDKYQASGALRAYEEGAGQTVKKLELKPLISFQWTKDPNGDHHFSLTLNPFVDISEKVGNRNRFGFQEPAEWSERYDWDNAGSSAGAAPSGGSTSPTNQTNQGTNTPSKSDTSNQPSSNTVNAPQPNLSTDDLDVD